MMPNFWQLTTTPILKIRDVISFDYSWFLTKNLSRDWLPKFATGLNMIICCSSKSIWVTRLLFCQNDSPMMGSFWKKNSFITHILFELQPIILFSPVSNFVSLPWKLHNCHKGPSISDVGKFSRFLTPTLLRWHFLLLSVGNFGQFLIPHSLRNADALNGWSLMRVN